MIAAGDLDKRVRVQKLVSPSPDPAMGNEYNAPLNRADDRNWPTVVTRWASIKPLSGRELFMAQQVRADVTHKVVLRYFKDGTTFSLRAGVKPTMRLVYQQRRKLNVVSCIDIDELHEELELLCIEEV